MKPGFMILSSKAPVVGHEASITALSVRGKPRVEPHTAQVLCVIAETCDKLKCYRPIINLVNAVTELCWLVRT